VEQRQPKRKGWKYWALCCLKLKRDWLPIDRKSIVGHPTILTVERSREAQTIFHEKEKRWR